MNIKRKIYFILTLLMAIVIFLFSSQKSEDSNKLSHRIAIEIFDLTNEEDESASTDAVNTENRVETIEIENDAEENSESSSKAFIEDIKQEPEYPTSNKKFRKIDAVVRKTAHVTLYALFAISLALFVKTYKIKNWKVVLIVLVVGFLYACLDEFNQKIRGTRSGRFSDCLIDTAGCLIRLVLVSAGEWIGKKWRIKGS